MYNSFSMSCKHHVESHFDVYYVQFLHTIYLNKPSKISIKNVSHFYYAYISISRNVYEGHFGNMTEKYQCLCEVSKHSSSSIYRYEPQSRRSQYKLNAMYFQNWKKCRSSYKAGFIKLWTLHWLLCKVNYKTNFQFPQGGGIKLF